MTRVGPLTQVCPAQRPLGLGVCLACTEGRSCMTGTCWPPACDSVHVQSPALVEVHAGTGALGGMPLGGRFRCVRPGSCRIQALRLPVPFLPSPWHLLFHCCSAFCFYGLDYSRDLICAESHSTCSLVSANFTEHNVLKPHPWCTRCPNVLPFCS